MFIYLDTETTGTGPADRICQIAFKIKGGYNMVYNIYGIIWVLMSMPFRTPLWETSWSWRRFLIGFTLRRLLNLGMIPLPK